MAYSLLANTRIVGCALSMGENPRTIEASPEYYNNDPALLARLVNTIGFGERRVANPTTTTSDMCTHAALQLMQAGLFEAKDLDAVISVTQTPDHLMPGNAHIIHAALGLQNTTAALDVGLGCSGYVYGLWLAGMMLSSGLQKVLLLAGDTLSKFANPKDRTLAPLFGDAGSATLLVRDENAAPMHCILKADGKGAPKMRVEAGAARFPSSAETRKEKEIEEGCVRSRENLYMDGFGIFEFTMMQQPPLLQEILRVAGKSIADTDFFILHQANRYIVETITQKAGIPREKAPVHGFTRFGNQNSASIPGVMCGILAEELAAKAAHVVLQGYGAGLSWGACYARLDRPVCLPPLVYDAAALSSLKSA